MFCLNIRMHERNRIAQYRHVNEYARKCFENARLYKCVINVKSMHINILFFQGYILF